MIDAVHRPAQCTISASSFNHYSLNADLSHLCKLNSCKLLCNNVNETLHSKLITFDVITSIGVQARVLIDCGSTTNFISQRYVLLNHIPTVNTTSSQVVKLADGSVQSTCKLVQTLHMYINDRDLCETYLVFPLDSYDIILGIPWLKKYNPIINWKTNTITFPTTPLQNLLKQNNIYNSSSFSSSSRARARLPWSESSSSESRRRASTAHSSCNICSSGRDNSE